MRKHGQCIWITVLTAALLVGCGVRTSSKDQQSDEKTIVAMNLDTGETKDFASAKDVPPGWAPCTDPSCTDGAAPPNVPCQNLGTDICEQNPDCRLLELSCMGTAVVCPEGADCPTTPAEPPECEYACIPKLPLRCFELADEQTCKARNDCDWAPIGIGACPEDNCNLGGHMCVEKAPPSCEQLAETQCSERGDCEWKPQPCPLCEPADGVCICPAFCQPTDQLPPGCPSVVSPPTDFCPDGVTEPIYDSNNCVVDFQCVEPTTPNPTD